MRALTHGIYTICSSKLRQRVFGMHYWCKTEFTVLNALWLQIRHRITVVTNFIYHNQNFFRFWPQLGVVHIWRPLRKGWGWGLRQKLDVIGRRGLGGWRVFLTSNPYFFIKENSICAMTRHHANMLIIYYWQEITLLTLTSDSEAIL